MDKKRYSAAALKSYFSISLEVKLPYEQVYLSVSAVWSVCLSVGRKIHCHSPFETLVPSIPNVIFKMLGKSGNILLEE